MLVHSLWDQEDIYGAMAVYKAIKPLDTGNDKVFSGAGAVASRAGDRRRGAAGGDSVRQRHRHLVPARMCCGRFWTQYLKDGAPAMRTWPR